MKPLKTAPPPVAISYLPMPGQRLAEMLTEAMQVWAPPPKLTVSEWADRNRVLSQEAASEPGRWRTSRAEYQRGIMDAFSDPRVEAVYVQKGTQVGWTDILNNVVGFHIDQDPAPMLVIQPTVEMGEAWSKDRLAPMLRDTPCLQGACGDPRSRDSGNTIRLKEFPGGRLTITGANSPASLAMRPIRIVLGDEVDRYPLSAGSEGEPLSLAFKRAETFWNRKLAAGSSPTIAGSSVIEARFLTGDQRRYFVPCKDCGEYQFLRWLQVKWASGNPKSANYVCEHCGSCWQDKHRHEAVKHGEWRAQAEFTGIASFHVPQLLSPWVKMSKMATEFLAAGKDPGLLQIFINTVLAETFAQKGEAPEWKRLYDRAEDYSIGTLPTGVLFLTAGVDVQQDRLEIFIWGWGRGLESWLIEYRVLPGNPYQDEVWAALSAVIGGAWQHEKGPMLPLMKVAVDSRYATTRVHAYVKQNRGIAVAVRGVDFGSAGVGHPQVVNVAPGQAKKKQRRGGTVYPVVVGIYKHEFYGHLRLDAPSRESGDPYPAGYVHLGKFDEEVFKQLTAEHLVTKIVKFKKRQEWEKTRERNEALDCRVYARAAATIYGIDRFQEKHWLALEDHLADTRPKPKKAAPPETESAHQPEAAPGKKKRGGWLGQRRGSWLKR